MTFKSGVVALVFCCGVWSVNAQVRDTLQVSFVDLNMETILDSVSLKSGYFFSYNANIMPSGSLFTLKKDSIHIDDLLDLLFVGTHLEYTKMGDQIILRQVIRDSQGNKRVYNKISGWVRDAQTQEPVFGAHVYINGSTIGTYTDIDGNYQLTNINPGNYQVVFSHIGYQPAAYEINSLKPSTYVINATMKEQTNLLEGVEVTSYPLVSDDNWIKYYRKFSDEFIGHSNNANRCSFRNPEVIEFAYSDSLHAYEAVTSEPLIMENMGLGYLVTFELDYFRSSPKETRFHVRASFEELEPENRRTKKRWRKNREKSYLGSSFHFFRSLMSSKMEDEGFELFLVEDPDDVLRLKKVTERDEILSTRGDGWYLDFEGQLIVDYDRELQHPSYTEEMGKRNLTNYGINVSSNSELVLGQRSVILLDEDQVRILKNGQITEPEDITALGYWSWERMSELMPIDYDPKSDNLLKR